MFTSIARLRSPGNGFEGIFEKFVFVLEISAVKVEKLCETNSLLSSFSENIVGRFLFVTLLMIFTLGTKLTFILKTRIFFPQSRVPRTFIWKIFTEYFVSEQLFALRNFKE